MFAGVPVAEGDGTVFFDGIEVDGDAKRGADLVLAAIAAADCAGGVVEDVPAALQFFVKLLRDFDEFWLVLE